MDTCVLEHCEFQHGGQCCLVCPKGLDKVNQKRATIRKIDECIKKLRRVKAKTEQVDEKTEPVGVSKNRSGYTATICFNGKMVCLGYFTDLEKAVNARAKAMEAKRKGVFPTWLKTFREDYEAAKKAKKTQKKA